jgi:hypothetical protein
MAGVVAAGVVFLSLIAGSTVAYMGFQAYKKRRRTLVVDEERERNLEYTAQHLQLGTALQDVDCPEHEYHSGQWYGSPGVVSANIALVAKPPPSSLIVEYTGGEGLVSPPQRVFVSEEAAKENVKERVLEDDQFRQQQVHVNRGFDLQGVGSGYTNMCQQEQIEMLSLKPRRTVTPKVNATPKDTAYDEEQEKISGYWEDIDNRKNINTGRKPRYKQPKQPLVPAQDTARSPAKVDETDIEDVDLNSGPAWTIDKRPTTPLRRKTLEIRESFKSGTTLGVVNNLNSERPLEHIISKQNMGPEYPKPAVVVDKATEMRRKVEEAKRLRAEKLRLEQHERQAEERRQAEQQQEREAERRRRAGEEQQRIKEARAQTLAQMTGTDVPKPRARKNSSSQRLTEVKNYGKYAFESSSDTGSKEARRQPARRGSSTSTDAKSSHKSRDNPFSRFPKRANTFAGAVTLDNIDATTISNTSGNGNSRSMSMAEQQRPNFTERMPSIVEAYSIANHDRNEPTQIAAPSPIYSLARSSLQQQRISDGSSALYSSSTESRPSSTQPQRQLNASSNDSQQQRRSNASSNDSPEDPSNPFANESKTSLQSRDSVDSKSSKKRKTSLLERAQGFKLGRKDSDKSEKLDKAGRQKTQQERNSAGSAQSWNSERDGPGLRGGGGTVFMETGEMSDVDDDEGKGKNVVPQLRGGEGSVEGSGSERDIDGKLLDDDMSDVDLNNHREDDESTDEQDTDNDSEDDDSENSDSDSDDDSEGESSDDDSDDESEADESERENPEDEATEDEDSDSEAEQSMLKNVHPLSAKGSEAIAVRA